MEKEYHLKKSHLNHSPIQLGHKDHGDEHLGDKHQSEGDQPRASLGRLFLESKIHFLSLCILLSAIIISAAWISTARTSTSSSKSEKNQIQTEAPQQNESVVDLEPIVLPKEGVVLPIQWGNSGKQLVETGVIDKEKLESLYRERGGIPQDMQNLLGQDTNEPITVNQENAGYLLNILWALGLGNKNPILEKGPMNDPQYGGAGNFASTGGWTLAKGETMNHYSKHQFVKLTKEQQDLVERVANNIYRPCCGNSVYFPDCNHGMAMLGLLELMASQGVTEKQMYSTALAVNAYWFPDTYLTIAQYLSTKGISWEDADPQEILGAQFSSAQGYRQVLNEVTPQSSKGGSGCGV